MARVLAITGINTVIKNMKRYDDLQARGLRRGLIRGGLFLQREAQKIVPVDTGNLKASAGTRNVGSSLYSPDIVVHFGDGANYAVYVHENLDSRHNKGQLAKYLEKPAKEKRDEILKIIREETSLI